jgi:long-chain acyl-CoA synthetase
MAAPDLGPNLAQLFLRRAAERGDRPMLWAKRNGAYQPWSWSRVELESRAIASALIDAGLEPGDRVLLVAENRPEWCIADLAILRAGGVTVPAYTTNTTDDHRFLLEHSEARFVVCSGPPLAKRLMPAVAQAPWVRLVLFIEPTEGWAVPSAVMAPWAEAVRQGLSRPQADRSAAVGPDDIACFIYTSGTGGRPKGVMLRHRNIMANLRGAWGVLERLGPLDDAVFLSFLPLSHAYEHTAGQFLPIAIGGQIYYAESVEALSANLVEAKPHILPCVPRLYEVMRQRILHAVDRQGGLRAWLFHKAVELGARRYERGRLGPVEGLLDRLLDKLVRDKARARFGGRLRALVSGGAPLSYEVGLFFTALGLPVAQGYGQTEAAPLISVNPPWRVKLRTVGPPVDGVEVRIAEDGEILVRGELVMAGYWKDRGGPARRLAAHRRRRRARRRRLPHHHRPQEGHDRAVRRRQRRPAARGRPAALGERDRPGGGVRRSSPLSRGAAGAEPGAGGERGRRAQDRARPHAPRRPRGAAPPPRRGRRPGQRQALDDPPGAPLRRTARALHRRQRAHDTHPQAQAASAARDLSRSPGGPLHPRPQGGVSRRRAPLRISLGRFLTGWSGND